MSRHLFCATIQSPAPGAGATSRVVIGWDRSLQRFFAYVLTSPGAQEQILYNSLRESTGGYLTAEEAACALHRAGVALPGGLLKQLRDDQTTNAGNSVTRWTEAGPEVVSVG